MALLFTIIVSLWGLKKKETKTRIAVSPKEKVSCHYRNSMDTAGLNPGVVLLYLSHTATPCFS